MWFWSKTQTHHLNCLNIGYPTGLVSHFLHHQLRDAVLSPEFVLKDSTSLIYQLECSSMHGHLSGTRCNPNISRCCSTEHFTPWLMLSMGLQHCKASWRDIQLYLQVLACKRFWRSSEWAEVAVTAAPQLSLWSLLDTSSTQEHTSKHSFNISSQHWFVSN